MVQLGLYIYSEYKYNTFYLDYYPKTLLMGLRILVACFIIFVFYFLYLSFFLHYDYIIYWDLYDKCNFFSYCLKSELLVASIDESFIMLRNIYYYYGTLYDIFFAESNHAVKTHNYIVQTFNVLTLCSTRYTVEYNSIRFLHSHGFDFNRQYAHGLPYTRGEDKEVGLNWNNKPMHCCFRLKILCW